MRAGSFDHQFKSPATALAELFDTSIVFRAGIYLLVNFGFRLAATVHHTCINVVGHLVMVER